MTMKTKKPKKDFLDGYKTYDPDVEGYGDSEQWRKEFNRIFTQEEIETIIGSDDPYVILGVAHNASAEEIKRAYKKLAIKLHPDRNKDRDTTKDFQRLQAAYQKIRE